VVQALELAVAPVPVLVPALVLVQALAEHNRSVPNQ